MKYSVTHPSTRILGSDTSLLKGKRIALGVTGSVAAFLSPQIARALIRHGATVIPVMTEAGTRMVGKDLMWWATGVEPITKVTGELEHISMAGVMNDPIDLFLIAPATTNTVAKLANGIADTSVTLIASSVNGKGVPIMVLCVAHEDLIKSPPIQKSLATLEEWGVDIIQPVVEEGKAKVPPVEDVIFEVIVRLSPKILTGKTVLVTGGPTREYFDNVRYITNGSSGRMGIEIAKSALMAGAETKLLLGPTHLTAPRAVDTISVFTTDDMIQAMLKELEKKPESMVILSSAMADFTPREKIDGKIKSGAELSVPLKPTTKLSNLIKAKFPQSTLVLFKAEWEETVGELAKRAKEKLESCDGDLVIANDLSRPGAGFAAISNHVIVMDKEGNYSEIEDSKTDIAQIIISRLSKI
ncbi:MAG: bifunctional phosphopantothenoylcysteine decarboxylase/phosphopantothenate--cysteine ligase CoaBC [Candidatus Kariarchaeaceae archaeon]|jgi:phosphopantothenoylcysteine decarboxylase/phosphopantothenate--cysteine ligase